MWQRPAGALDDMGTTVTKHSVQAFPQKYRKHNTGYVAVNAYLHFKRVWHVLFKYGLYTKATQVGDPCCLSAC